MSKFVFCLLLSSALAKATIFGRIQGVVHDPQHRPIVNALVKLEAATSQWSSNTESNADGEFSFLAVPVGEYRIVVAKKGFETERQSVVVDSRSAPVLHFQLALATLSQSTVVEGEATPANLDSATPTTLIDRQDIELTPGASRTNSMAMITDFVPAAYMTHDMLHMRGGHQTSWLVDGVPVPNTNIASNLGPQIDPKDIDYLEVQRGSYDADYGDRTYGIFNIVPRTGFERNNEAELVASFGNFYQTNDQFNFGGHTTRLAYYFSVNANRSDYGLQTPIGPVVHDAQNGYGGFGSLIFNASAANQYRLTASLRQDYYQIPIDPDPNSPGNQYYASYALHDVEREPDGYINFSWVHTFSPKLLLTVSPFYHFNKADYQSSPNDFPVITNVTQTANYGGAQATLAVTSLKNNDIQAGIYGFAQHQSNFFNNVFTDCGDSCANFGPSSSAVTGGVFEGFVSDRVKLTQWITLTLGLRLSHFNSGGTNAVSESAVDPRLGAAIRLPKLNWVVRGFYGQFYQPPPLLTATGPLLSLADSQNLAFGALKGERDHEYQVGLMIPFHGWVIDGDTFQTKASNWLDHSNIGESNLFWPITWAAAFVKGWEATLRSPSIAHHGQVHLAYSHQIVEAEGPFTGGLICAPGFETGCEPDPGFAPADHDQRNTLNIGATATLPKHIFAAVNIYYGSGFTNGLPNDQYPGDYLPAHRSYDLSLAKTFGEEGKYRISLNAINLANQRVLLDNSLTFGGFHYNDPRQLYTEFRWRFHL